jgi:WD40 repeat protein
MKNLILTICITFAAQLFSQSYNFTVGERRSSTSIEDPEIEYFENYGKKYLLNQTYSFKEGMQVQLQGFKENNDYLCSKKLYVPEEKMLISIYEGILNLDNNMQLIKSTFNKEAKKTFIYAHAINEYGDESDDRKEILSITAEKAMNSGNFSCATSPNRKFSVVLTELPFVKETKEKIMVTVFDNALKTVFSKEFELPYDSKRGVTNKPIVANDGAVYIVKKADISKMPDLLTVFSISASGETIKENSVKLDDPKKLESFAFNLNTKNELVVVGYYTEDGKVSFGGTKQKGLFCLNVNSKGDQLIYQTSEFPKHYISSKIRQVLVNDDGKIAMICESYSKVNNSTMGANNQLVYTTDITQGDAYIHTLNAKGELVKSYEFSKSSKSVADGGLYGSVFGAFNNNKLVVVYNDFQYKHDGKKYIVVPPTIAWIKIPIIQTIDLAINDVRETVFIDASVGGKEDLTHLLPLTGFKVSNDELFFLGGKDADVMPIVLKIK